MIRTFLITALIFTSTIILAQSARDITVNQILIYGDYNYGLPLQDTAAKVIVRIVTSNYTDTTTIDFDSHGRIKLLETKFLKCWFEYQPGKIRKHVKSKHPMTAFKTCDEYDIDYYFLDGKLKYADQICDGKVHRRNFSYSVSNEVISVNTLSKEGVRTDVVLFDLKGNMQWQTINPTGGFRLNYSCNYALREYVTNLGLDTSVMYATITNETFFGNNRQVIKDRYTIFNGTGNRYGEIFVDRQPLD